MKVLLINPNYREVYNYVGREATMISPPMGLAYLASYLRNNEIEVKILDACALDLDSDEILEEIKKFDSDYVGITASTNTINLAYKIANLVSGLKCKVVVGGAHTSILPAKTLEECENIDIVAIGEGEDSLLEIVSGKELEKIEGIGFRKNKKIIINLRRKPREDLDSLPFPAYDLLPLDKYWSPGIRRYPFATIVTSRGCPFNCIFCVNHLVSSKKFRARSPENVLKEIDLLVKEYGIKEINVLDDNFTLLLGRAKEICNGLIKRNYDLILKTGNGIRADKIDEELISLMKKAGFYLLAFGIESGNKEILKIINKGETLEQIEEAIKLCKKYKILTEGFFILGNLGETEGTMQDTINFAKKLDLDIAQFQAFIPFPGSKFYNEIKKNGEIFSKNWEDYNAFDRPIFRYKNLTPELMSRMQNKAYKEYYLRPKIILRKLFEIRNLNQFKAYALAGLSVIKFRRKK